MRTRVVGAIVFAAAVAGPGAIDWTSVAVVVAQVRQHDVSWRAPAAAGAKVNPLLNRRDAAAGGGKLFQQRCTTCHGDGGRGTAKGPDLTLPRVQAETDGELYWKISSGNTHAGMPAFSFLPALQRWQLVLHLRECARTIGYGITRVGNRGSVEHWREPAPSPGRPHAAMTPHNLRGEPRVENPRDFHFASQLQ